MNNLDVPLSTSRAHGSPRVSVIVPHYRDLTNLDLCLASLERQRFAREDFEIIVGDNNSPEGQAEVERVISGRARLVIVTEKGAGPARNGAVAAAKGGILAFIDSDCRAEPDWLSEGVKALGTYDFVGGRVRVLVDDMTRMTPVEAFERVFAFDFRDYILNKGFTGSGNMFCPRAVFETVGGFRAVVSEDVDWSHRARALGYRLGYAPNAVIGHPARRTWDELLVKWRKANTEAFHLMTERRGGRWTWLIRCVALPVSAIAHTPKVLASRELVTLAQRSAALSVLYRLRWWRFRHALGLLGQAPR